MSLVQWLDKRLYPGFERNWDDRLFRERLLACSGSEFMVLDLGAGAGIIPEMNLRGRVCRVCGVDPDSRVVTNPYLDEGRVGLGEDIPYADGSFDLVIADNVLEHLEEPQTVFGEVARVLRPGGRFLAKTPNARHYVPLIARLTPHRFHQWVIRIKGGHRTAEDTFPTRYRANTPGDVRRLAGNAGLMVEDIELIEGRPEYLRMTVPTYLVGWLYERLVNLTPLLAPFRVLLIAVLRKPAD